MAVELWESYRQAVVHVALGVGLLELRADPTAPGGPFVPGVAAPVHVVTAWNPGGVRADDTTNRDAGARLLREVLATGLSHWPADGAAPDRSWVEQGVAVAGLSRAEAVSLGRRHGQLAIYEWADEPDGFRLIACAEGEIVAAQPWRSELRGQPV